MRVQLITSFRVGITGRTALASPPDSRDVADQNRVWPDSKNVSPGIFIKLPERLRSIGAGRPGSEELPGGRQRETKSMRRMETRYPQPLPGGAREGEEEIRKRAERCGKTRRLAAAIPVFPGSRAVAVLRLGKCCIHRPFYRKRQRALPGCQLAGANRRPREEPKNQ
jgi:hypothetical protein